MQDENSAENRDEFADLDNLLAEEKLLDQLKQYRAPAPGITSSADNPPHNSPQPQESSPIEPTQSDQENGEESLEDLSESQGSIPVRKSIFDDPEFQKQWAAPRYKKRNLKKMIAALLAVGLLVTAVATGTIIF